MEKYSFSQPKKDGHILGEKTKHLVITADESDDRDWLKNRLICPLLAQHYITHMGIMWAQHPLEITRFSQDGSFFMACIKGEGQVLFDEGWKTLKEGDACLLPPFTMNSFRAIEGKEWDFCWVRYNEIRHRMPISNFLTPVKQQYDHQPLVRCIQGIYHECEGDNNPALLNLWTELIQQYVLKFTKHQDKDQRLWKLWKSVELDLGKDWNLKELASIACVSEEHLRRLCNKQLGRSPMQQLTYLRMQKARFLLGTTDDKIDTIANMVGYENPFTFSNTFKKWVGWRPSEVR